MPARATTPEPDGAAPDTDTTPAPAPPLYGDKPVFTYTPKDGGEPILFPAHSTIRGEIGGIKYLEFLWEIDELSSADQIFAYLRRSGATKAMQRRCVRLEEEVTTFFRDWINASDEDELGLPGGILTLARAVRQHWHAVQRDIIALGYRKADMFTTLNVNEMTSIVLAAPPGSAVHHAINKGWTMTDHLLATGFEQAAGLTRLPRRIARPGVTDTRPSTPARVNDHTQLVQRITFDTMTIDELEAKRAAHYAKAKGG